MKTRISVVSYLNSKPYLYGLRYFADPDYFEVSTDIPSVCADKMIRRDADVGLVPVAMIPGIPDAKLITGFGIAANGAVDSVVLCSRVPLNEIKMVVLDIESRTSANLARILAKELWRINPEWVREDEHKRISSGKLPESVVLIGDRALAYRNMYQFQYDLAEEWKKLTGLPFVFAAWVRNKELLPGQEELLRAAFEKGIEAINEVIRLHQDEYPFANLETYLHERIRYRIDTEAEKAIALYLEKLAQYQLLPSGTVVAGEIT
jgi:chorismate dehydratase